MIASAVSGLLANSAPFGFSVSSSSCATAEDSAWSMLAASLLVWVLARPLSSRLSISPKSRQRACVVSAQRPSLELFISASCLRISRHGELPFTSPTPPPQDGYVDFWSFQRYQLTDVARSILPPHHLRRSHRHPLILQLRVPQIPSQTRQR